MLVSRWYRFQAVTDAASFSGQSLILLHASPLFTAISEAWHTVSVSGIICERFIRLSYSSRTVDDKRLPGISARHFAIIPGNSTEAIAEFSLFFIFLIITWSHTREPSIGNRKWHLCLVKNTTQIFTQFSSLSSYYVFLFLLLLLMFLKWITLINKWTHNLSNQVLIGAQSWDVKINQHWYQC